MTQKGFLLNQSKGFAPILIILSVVILVAGGIGYLFYVNNSKKETVITEPIKQNSVPQENVSPTPSPSPTSSQTSSVNLPTEDWSTYGSSYYLIKYPKKWKAVFPGGNLEQTDGPVLALQSPCDRATSGRCWEVGIDSSWLKAFSNLESPILNENLIQTKDVVISGQTAKEYIIGEPSSLCQGKFVNSAEDYGDYGCVSDLYVVNHNNKGFTINLIETARKTNIKSIEDWKDKKTLDAILSTFKFK